MNQARTSDPQLPPFLPKADAEAFDPELVALPAPPRGRRRLSIALLGSVLLGAASLLLHLRLDVAYSLSPRAAVDIGDATRATLAALEVNRHVRVHGTLMLAHGVRFERTFSGRNYAVFPLAGQRQIFVQLDAAALQDPSRVARGEFSGRLLTFGQAGPRLREVRAFIARTTRAPVSDESFILLAGEAPDAYRSAWLLCAACALMIALSLGLLWRWFRPIAP